MLQVKGRSDLFLKLEIIKKTIAVGPILAGIFIDIKWMLWGSVATGIVAYYLNSYYSGRDLQYSLWEQIKDIAPSFGIASIMAVLVYALSFLPLSPYFLLPLQLLLGGSLVIFLCEKINTEAYKDIKSIVIPMINKLRHGR